jgi:hypothetical protein
VTYAVNALLHNASICSSEQPGEGKAIIPLIFDVKPEGYARKEEAAEVISDQEISGRK